MKTTLFVLITVSGFALPADALDLKAITAKPTADNPQYKNKEAWPDLVGDEYFPKQEWPKARLLIWGHAGVVPKRSDPKIDPKDPANWIDAATGKAADAIPDMDTDVILPDTDRPYSVSKNKFVCRHLTIGRNAKLVWLWPKVFGNVWIRPGGKLFAYKTLMLLGSRDTFFRNDWPEDGVLKKLHDTGGIVAFDPANPKDPNPWVDKQSSVCQFLSYDRPKGSTEMIGYSYSHDEIGIKAGTLIVGRDSRFLCGGPARIYINEGAAIVLMDGAVTGKTVNQFRPCLVMQGGQITAGTPDRPVKRDARIGVGYSNWMNLSFPDQKKSQGRGMYAYGDFSASLSGKLIGYPAEGSDARLVFGWQRVRHGGGGRGVNHTDGFKQVFAKLQPKITVWVAPETEIKNVRFEDLHRGGIVVHDAAAAKNWKNVTYGNGCLSKDPKELIREYKGKVHRGRPMEQLKPEKKYTSM